MHSAYLDRFTDDGYALMLVENLNKQFHVPTSLLPEGSVAGIWFLVEVQGEEITSLEIDENKTTNMKTDIDNTMQRLQSKKKSRFKRK